MPAFRITLLTGRGDQRGASYQAGSGWADFLGEARELHMVTILPGHTRGNHYHTLRKEVLVVLYHDAWLLRWDTGAGTPVEERVFDAEGAVLVEADPGAAHAIHNSGQKTLVAVSLGNHEFDPTAPDVVARKLVP